MKDYKVCDKTANGVHVPDWTTARYTDAEISERGSVIDVNCIHCGQSGGVPVDNKDIDW